MNRRGFTLIEVLVGIAIFSIIALSLYSSFAAGVHLNHKIEKPLQVQRDAFWALEQMGHDLENMTPYDFTNSYKDKKSFTLDKKTLVFLMPTGKGLKAIRYSLQSLDETKVKSTKLGITTDHNVAVTNQNIHADRPVALVKEEQDFSKFLQSGFDDASREILSRYVAQDGLNILCAQASTAGQGAVDWVDDWSTDAIPQGIRIELTMIVDEAGTKSTFRRDVFVPTGILHETEKQ